MPRFESWTNRIECWHVYDDNAPADGDTGERYWIVYLCPNCVTKATKGKEAEYAYSSDDTSVGDEPCDECGARIVGSAS